MQNVAAAVKRAMSREESGYDALRAMSREESGCDALIGERDEEKTRTED